ncbi:MAG: hypothetical protein CVV52_03880 [Spirochaetae bacterium HGW-Spirochaetae-8]|jgi:DNA-binding MurR/RpiR family transcriptional regulator|nr:MAG: hypothetical protein CVV52_03880 [Spirochaetae bacterium HGW-Spirochaetae-8]
MDSLLFLLELKLEDLPESELKIANYILKQKTNVIHQSVMEVAKGAGASTSAVIRLCKSLDIPSFQELKIMLARDVFIGTSARNEDKGVPDDPASATTKELIQQTSISSIESIKDLAKMVSIEHCIEASKLLIDTVFIHAFGIGLSNGIAFDFAHKMQRIGLLCGYSQETQMQMITACNLKPGMVGVVVSHSGNTKEMVRAAKIMKQNGVKVISITGNPHGDLVLFSDIVLLAPLSEPLKRQGASSSRISQLVLIDMLFSLIIEHRPETYGEYLAKTSKAFN